MESISVGVEEVESCCAAVEKVEGQTEVVWPRLCVAMCSVRMPAQSGGHGTARSQSADGGVDVAAGGVVGGSDRDPQRGRGVRGVLGRTGDGIDGRRRFELLVHQCARRFIRPQRGPQFIRSRGDIDFIDAMRADIDRDGRRVATG